jgi:hypothetical protein
MCIPIEQIGNFREHAAVHNERFKNYIGALICLNIKE